MKKTNILGKAAFAAFALALFSCGSTKKAPVPPEEQVSEELPEWDDEKESSEDDKSEKASDESTEKSDESSEKSEDSENAQASENADEENKVASEKDESEGEEVSQAGVRREGEKPKSGDYPNMDRGAKESEVSAEEGKKVAPKKRVAVAKSEDEIVVVDDLPNIVQENESVLFSSDWDEESLSDPEDCGYFYTTDNLGDFSMVKGEFRKLGGYEGSTVGFVFGFSSAKDGWLKDYIRFEINTRGEYGIYSWDGKRYTDLVQKNKPDTAYLYESAAINAGYNRKNTLTIQKEKDGTYTLSINDTVVAKKVPPLKKGTKGVMAFFSVGKDDQENFPENPVTVTYRITDTKK